MNLGCGNDVRWGDGWENHDLRRHREGIDHEWDLNDRPWPWPDDTFDRVDAISVLEHLELTLVESLEECWRIVQPSGELHVKYPVHTSPFIHHDPTHRWYWSAKSIDFVDPATKYGKSHAYYTDRHWEITRKKHNERNCWVTLRPVK